MYELIARLSAGLVPADRTAFRKTAEAASGNPTRMLEEGSAYRVVAKLWRAYFRSPSNTGGASWYEKHQRAASKLMSKDPY